MYVPEERLSTALVALIGLNPGGRQIDPPPQWDYRRGGNAYVDESWRGLEPGEHHLQKEVRLLLSALGAAPDEIFAANMVPFRSPSWTMLPDKPAALAFGREVWRWILPRSRIRLFVSMGKPAGKAIAGLIGAGKVGSMPVEWGRVRADLYRTDDGRMVVSLPHLSRYKIFGGGRTAARAVVAEVAREVFGSATMEGCTGT